MKLWTLCEDRKKWKNSWVLSRSDSMGNVLDRIEKDKKSPLKLVDYPDDFLEQFAYIFDDYVYLIDETSFYDNDDYPEYSYSDRKSTYTEVIYPRNNIVISGGRPVGHMVEITSYAGGMDARTRHLGYIAFFEKPDRAAGETFSESYSANGGNSRSGWTRSYSIIKACDAHKKSK